MVPGIAKPAPVCARIRAVSILHHKASFALRDRARYRLIVERETNRVDTIVNPLVTKPMAADRDILAGLRPNYRMRLGARVSRLRTFAEALGQGALQMQQHDDLHRTAHSMASSAAIFGHSGLSAAACNAERAFEASTGNIVEQRASLSCLLEEARRVLDSGA
jgi:HPt (histidine-containing phosphotransfer) domain-containing protein